MWCNHYNCKDQQTYISMYNHTIMCLIPEATCIYIIVDRCLSTMRESSKHSHQFCEMILLVLTCTVICPPSRISPLPLRWVKLLGSTCICGNAGTSFLHAHAIWVYTGGWIWVDMGGYVWIWVDMGGYGWIWVSIFVSCPGALLWRR